MALRLYWEVARRAFRRYSTYRGANLAGLFTNTVFGFIRAYVLIALYRHRTDVGGFDVTDAVTFCFVSQGFLMLTEAFGTDEIAERVRTGDIVTDFYRPVDFQQWWFAQDLGRAAFHTLTRGIPPVLAGALFFHLRFDTDPVVLAAFACSVLFAVSVSFGIRFITNLSAFWLLDIRGVRQLVTLTQLFFAGLAVPITFFPHWLEQFARVLPFAAVLQVPIEIILGKHHGTDLAAALGAQLAWAVALWVTGAAVVNGATRKVIIQGG
jgi:ABC-2 type transport system permease protein